MLKLVKIQVRLLHAYQNKRLVGFAATSLDEIKILNVAERLGFRYSMNPAWAPAQIGSVAGGIEINCGRTVQAIRPSS